MIDATFNKINKIVPTKWQWVLNHEGFRRYFKNTGWMFVSRVLCMILSFFTTAFVARKLGPINFGQLSYAVSFVSLFSVVATLGIDNVLYRDLIKNPDKRKEFLGSAFFIKLVAGTLATILVIVSAVFFAENDVSRILILILSSTFIFNAFQVINYEFQAQVKSKYPSIISFFVIAILSLLKIIVVLNNQGVIYLSLVLLSESVLYAIFFGFIYKRKIGGRISEWRLDKNIAKTLLKDSWPIIFSSAFILIYSRIDQIILKHLMNSGYVGLYSSAVVIAEAWYFLPNIIVSSLFPSIVNAKKISENVYYNRIRKMFILLLILSVSASVLTNIFAAILIKIIYGNEYFDAISILKIYSWSNIGIFLSGLAMNYLVVENKRIIIAFMAFVPMITNVILNLLLIPKYGMVGSAYATLISYSLGPVSIMLFKTPRKIFLLK